MRSLLSPFAACCLFAVAIGGTVFAGERKGVLFTTTNATIGNEMVVHLRLETGELIELYRAPTRGLGTGAGLGSQGAIVETEDGRFLLSVNAGSNDVSVFRVFFGALLVLRDVQPSGGTMPVSIAVHGNVVYVLNAGEPNNVNGFHLRDGDLEPISGSERPLSAAQTAPAQMEFSPDGKFLVVTEKMTDLIDVFPVEHGGTLGDAVLNPSSGATPFGFEFRGNRQLIISEAFGGSENASAVSSYFLRHDGTLQVISASVPTGQTAACWIVITDDRHFTYTSNTGSDSITGYRIKRSGQLERFDDGSTGVTGDGSAPTDVALSRGSRFLYALGEVNGTIAGFEVLDDGGLALVSITAPTLPPFSAGLVAH